MDFYSAVLKSGYKSNTLLRVSFYDYYGHLLNKDWNQNDFGLVKGVLNEYVKNREGNYIRDNLYFFKPSFRFTSEYTMPEFSTFLLKLVQEVHDLKNKDFNVNSIRFEFSDVPNNATFIDLGYLDIQVNRKAYVVTKNEHNTYLVNEFMELFDLNITPPDLDQYLDVDSAIEAYRNYAKRLARQGFTAIQNNQLIDILHGRNYYTKSLFDSAETGIQL